MKSIPCLESLSEKNDKVSGKTKLKVRLPARVELKRTNPKKG